MAVCSFVDIKYVVLPKEPNRRRQEQLAGCGDWWGSVQKLAIRRIIYRCLQAITAFIVVNNDSRSPWREKWVASLRSFRVRYLTTEPNK
jgi:hypothetical protein